MVIPENVKIALDLLNEQGYKAYIVGGCVRDGLLGIPVSDYDITTDALPSEIKKVFSDFTVHETGIKHGTLTVVSDGTPLEITTFRIDGEYKDNRHPDSVTFTEKLENDVKRRDFTVNSICYNPREGIVDLLGGKGDLEKNFLRTCGDASCRFREDSLRILRALRFSAVYGFKIEEQTKEAIHNEKKLLLNVAKERICAELKKLLCAKNAGNILREYKDVFEVIIPELSGCIGFDQHSKYHTMSVYDHMVSTLENVEERFELRLAAFLHDIGKPNVFSLDEKGEGHFYGHEKESEEIVKKIVKNLKFDNVTCSKVTTLVKYHGLQIVNTKNTVKRWLFRLGEENFFDLIKIKKADNASHGINVESRLCELSEIENMAREILSAEECFRLGDLCVDGRYLIEKGFKEGKIIGDILNELLNLVIEGKIENSREAVDEYLKKYGSH